MRKNIVALLAIGFVGLAGPALADSANGSTEHTTDADGNTVYTNDLQCGAIDGDGGQVPDVDSPAGNVYTTGDPAAASGGVEVCADGSDEVTVIQGRVIAEGGASDGGGVAAIDGDKDNTQAEQLTGWARVDVSGDGPAVSCGDDGGNLDSTHPTAGVDGQEDCG